MSVTLYTNFCKNCENNQENTFVRRLGVSNGAMNGLFLGAALSGKGGSYGWIDGTAWDYQNFAPGKTDRPFSAIREAIFGIPTRRFRRLHCYGHNVLYWRLDEH